MISRTRLRTATCLFCQWRSFSVSYRRFAAPNKLPTAAPAKPPTDQKTAGDASKPAETSPAKVGPLANVPRSYGEKVDSFTPTPLGRPIGMNTPPKAGENTGVDSRSLKQRRDDFVDYDKHLKRREYL